MPLWIFFAACGGRTVEFPPGLEPLEASTAPCPDGEADAIELVSGEAGHFWTHACALVAASPPSVVEALRTPEAGVDRMEVDEYTVSWDVEPGYDVSYAVDTVVHDIVDVQYVLTWRHGDLDDTRAATRWLMTETDPFVDLIEGSITATELSSALVRLEMVYRVGAPARVDTTTTEGFLTRFHASVAALARGEPLPTYE